jgi:phosphoglycolate phosphatase
MVFPFRAVGFDLDGTLLDTHRDLGDAVNHALTLGGFTPVPVEEVEGLIGGGAKLMLEAAIARQGGLPQERFRALYKALLAYYAKNNTVYTRPYPGAVEALDVLAGEGVQLAIVTNKFESFAREILAKLGLADRFVAIIGGDTLGKGRAKPAPDPIIEARARCGGGSFAFVGDSTYDIAAAKAAGVPVIAVGFGYSDLPPGDLGADEVIASYGELVPALCRL